MTPLQKQQWQWGLSGSCVGGMIVGVAAFVATRLLFNIPHFAKRENPMIWFSIYALGGAILFGIAFVLLARRNPKFARYGVYLVHIITIVLILMFLGVKLLMPRGQ